MAGGAHWTTTDDRAVTRLLDQVRGNPLGHVSPSWYETARLLVLAPWLPGHADRLRFLLREATEVVVALVGPQNVDGPGSAEFGQRVQHRGGVVRVGGQP